MLSRRRVSAATQPARAPWASCGPGSVGRRAWIASSASKTSSARSGWFAQARTSPMVPVGWLAAAYSSGASRVRAMVSQNSAFWTLWDTDAPAAGREGGQQHVDLAGGRDDRAAPAQQGGDHEAGGLAAQGRPEDQQAVA